MIKLPNMQTRKKICLAITKGIWGGAQEYVYTLATNLPREQFDVFVIVGEGNVLQEKLKKENIRTYTLSSLRRDVSLFAEIKTFFSLLNILRKEKPDVLHLNSAKAGGLGALAGRLIGIPRVIFTAHGWTFNEPRPLFNKLIVTFLSWMTVLLCHKIIVIAEREKRQALAMPFVHPSHITLVRNGIAHTEHIEPHIAREYLKSKNTYADTEPLTEKTIWLGTISELHKNKGLEYAIIALAKLNYPFVFYIIGDGEQRMHLESLIRTHKLTQKIFLIGFLPHAKTYLKAFDIFLMSSVKEGMPYAILEAGQASIAVIATKVGGIPEILTNNENGILISPKDPREILRAVTCLVEHREKRAQFGANLNQKVEKDFGVERMIEETMGVYKK